MCGPEIIRPGANAITRFLRHSQKVCLPLKKQLGELLEWHFSYKPGRAEHRGGVFSLESLLIRSCVLKVSRQLWENKLISFSDVTDLKGMSEWPSLPSDRSSEFTFLFKLKSLNIFFQLQFYHLDLLLVLINLMDYVRATMPWFSRSSLQTSWIFNITPSGRFSCIFTKLFELKLVDFFRGFNKI